ncbi:SCO2525 family SAM-dependent methyltransferase [Actinocrispum wychmicini]|nr:SCO2525 family SAM-dependent methyltransferase [Actinocrispum wychmicini]
MAPGSGGKVHNDEVDWGHFDADEYYRHNYLKLRADDEEILGFVRDHFASLLDGRDLPAGYRGIDVGTGPNLYPALSMLPFCDNVTLFEHAEPNISWLQDQKRNTWPSWSTAWHQFWDVLRAQQAYARITDPRSVLAKRVEIHQGNVYELKTLAPFNVGTMFFVAESITGQESEFRSAMDHFLDVLAPGAPFAIALMEHSTGYHVADSHFPATDIDEGAVSSCFRNRVSSISIKHIDVGARPLRDGYTGMLIALGQMRDGEDRALT